MNASSTHWLGSFLGRFLFFWTRGREYIDLIRGWITPTAATMGVAKYLDLTTGQSVLMGLGVALFAVCFGLTLGWIDVHVGGLRIHTQASNLNDPWRVETLELLRTLARSHAIKPEGG